MVKTTFFFFLLNISFFQPGLLNKQLCMYWDETLLCLNFSTSYITDSGKAFKGYAIISWDYWWYISFYSCSPCFAWVRLILSCTQRSQPYSMYWMLGKKSELCFHWFTAHFVDPSTKDLDLEDIFLKAMTFLHSETSLTFPKGHLQVNSYQ